jgi:DDE superfamily endonuclease/Helix-turn-helix of DDE superfamily endonuclease
VRPLQKKIMQYLKTRQNERQFKALTSLSLEQFDALLPIFECKWEDFIEKFNLDGTPRMRKYVPKNEKQLPTVADKLFFVLFYQKTNSLQEVVAAHFDLDVSMVNKWIHILSPILDKSLEKYAPKSRIEEVKFEKDETYITDGSERPIQRDTYQQEEFYSGKKGTHTMKNALLITTIGLIVWLGATHIGKTHDKKLVENLHFKTPIKILADLGFLAWNPKNVELILPYKKPRNTKTEKRDLTQEQKDFNLQLSKKRVKVENVLAHVKIFRIVKDRNRNYRFGFRENLMFTACAMYNFRLNYSKIVQNKENIC